MPACTQGRRPSDAFCEDLSGNYQDCALATTATVAIVYAKLKAPTTFPALVAKTSNATAIPSAPLRLLLVLALGSSHDAMILAWRAFFK